MAQTFYRVNQAASATAEDFLSDRGKGKPPRGDDPVSLEVWDGISVFRTRAQARKRARAYPWFGEYIAELRVPEDGSIRYKRTLSSAGHHTIWGEPEELLALVVPEATVRA
jgi:hypothetical protein